jgi:hypothetical protein
MKLLRFATVLIALLPAMQARAETPAQVYEISSVGPSPCAGSTTGLRCNDLTNFPFVMVNGYYAPGDGGGGYFVKGASGCQDNGGTVLKDGALTSNCFYRASTNWNVREWGAKCDVNAIFDTGSYNATSHKFHWGSAQALTSADIGKTIAIPGLGAGPYYPVKTVIANMGGSYSAGNVLTLTGGSYTSPATIKLDKWDVGTSTVVFHFVSYGSYTTPPTNPISTMGGGDNMLTLNSAWGGATFTTKIDGVDASTTSITLHDIPPFPIDASPNEWYYGDDDGAAINGAIANVSAAGATQINIPGNCGTTVQINASTAAISNPALMGLSTSASGLYALGPITGNVFNRSSTNSGNAGGGLSNMTVEGMGLTSDGSGHGSPVVAINGGKMQTFSNLNVRDAVGSLVASTGNLNAGFRCGSDTDNNADAGNNLYQNINAQTDQSLFSGAQFPDADFDAAGQCHDSRFYADTAVNASLANFMHVNGGGLHIDHLHTFNSISPNAFTLNTTGSASAHSTTLTLSSPPTGPTAGMAIGGIGIPVGDTITNISGSTVTLLLQTGAAISSGNITITDGYRGVEISDGDYGATITATSDQFSPNSSCNIADSALIQQDGAASTSTAVFANGHASYSTIPSIYSGVAAQRPEGRLTLVAGSPVMNADSTNATSIYYSPFVGAYVPIFNGQQTSLYQFTSSSTDQNGLTLQLDNNSGHTGYQQKGHLFDLYAALDGTTVRLCTGPSWSSTSSRGSGSDIAMYFGVWTNAATISCRWGSSIGYLLTCPANRCTYLGTMQATADGQTCVQVKPAAANGGVSNCGSGNSGAYVGLWNAYNRVRVVNRIQDSTGGWHAQSATTWEPGDTAFTGTNTNNRINFLVGLPVTQVQGSVYENNISSGATPTTPWIGVDFDSTTAAPDVICKQQATQIVDAACATWSVPALGSHYLQAMEQAATTAGTPFGVSLTTALDWEY